MAEKRVIELDIETNALSLRAQLKEAQADVQQLSEKFGATSKEAINAAKRAAELKDAIADAKDLTDSFNPDAKFNALSRSVGGVLDGFQSFEGALGIIGVESAALQETMVRLQSVMALSQGLQGLMEAKDSFKQLGAVASDAFGKMTTAGKAFAVTGIGLLITGITLLIANFDKVKEVLGGVTSKQELLNSTLDEYKQGAQDAIKETNEVANAFDLAKQGVISKEEALTIYNDTLGDSFGKASNLNEAERLYNAKTDAYIKATALRAQSQALFAKAAEEQVKALTASMEDQTSMLDKAKAGLLSYFGLQGQALKSTLDSQKKGEKEAKKNADKRADEFNKLGKKLLKEAELVENKNKIISTSEKKTNDAIIAKNNERASKANEALNRELEQIREWNKQAQAENAARLRTDQEQEEFLIKQKYEEQIKLFQKHKKDTKELEIAQANELNEIRLKYQKIEYDKQDEIRKKELDAIKQADQLKIEQENALQAEIEAIDESNFQLRLKNSMTDQQYEIELVRQKYFTLEEQAKGNAEQLAIIEEAKNNEIDQINQTYADKEKQRKKANKDFAIEMAQSGLSTIQGLTELFGKKNEKAARKAFQINKAAQIASATIDTYKSATSAYASQIIPGDPTSPVRAAIAAGVAIAAGLVNVAKIASQKFEGGGSSGGGGTPSSAGGGGEMQAPNFNVIGTSGVNQLAQIQQQPTRAYVVSGDVANGLSLERNRLQNATL